MKNQIKKYRTPRKILNRKSFIKRKNQMPKHIKRMENECYIPDCVIKFLS